MNVHGNKTDDNGYDCDSYKTAADCGKHDNDNFDSYKMCCSCGGGVFGRVYFFQYHYSI